jgi:alkylation response protein AidB-like acyl-CoA dehydrogenase
MFLALDEAELAVADAVADFQELLVRTDPESERHHGLTWMICDMRAPGIEIRPIPTMLQDEHVSRVFDDEVRIPLANVVGDIGNGWATALATPSFERGTRFIGDQLEILREITADRLLGLPRAR